MVYVLSDELDEGEPGADSDFARKEAESQNGASFIIGILSIT